MAVGVDGIAVFAFFSVDNSVISLNLGSISVMRKILNTHCVRNSTV